MACGGSPPPPAQNVAPVDRPPTLGIAPPVSWTLEAGPAEPLALSRFATAGQWTYDANTRGQVESSGLTDPRTEKLDESFTLEVTSEGKGRAKVTIREELAAGATGRQPESLELEVAADGTTERPILGEFFGLLLAVPPTGLAVGGTRQRPFAYPLALETGTVQTGTEQVTFRGYATAGGTACAWYELHATITIKGGENEIHGTGVYDRHVCFDPRDASLVAASIGIAEDITVVSTTTFADGESYGPMKSRRVSKIQHILTRK